MPVKIVFLVIILGLSLVGCRTFLSLIEPPEPPESSERSLSCDELAPQIIELTEEQEGPFSAKILKLYDIEEVEPLGYVLRCQATAKWNRIHDDGVITFYIEEDKDGDQFIGLDFPDW